MKPQYLIGDTIKLGQMRIVPALQVSQVEAPVLLKKVFIGANLFVKSNILPSKAMNNFVVPFMVPRGCGLVF